MAFGWREAYDAPGGAPSGDSMRLRAATKALSRNGGWDAAFGVALLAAVLGALVLVVVVQQRVTDSPVQADSPANPAPTTTAPTFSAATQRSNASIQPQPTPRVSATAAPVATFGRSLTLIEDATLRDRISQSLGEEAEHFSVVVVRQSDGRAALIEADRIFYAASLFKLAILYEAGLRLSQGTLGLDDRLFLSEEDIAQDLGTLQYVSLDEERSLPVSEALEAMVTLSDNSIAVALLHVFTGNSIDTTLRGLGIANTSVNTVELPATARDMARIMDAILAGEGLDPAAHALLLGMLSRQQTRDGIPQGLPDGVASGNKTGTWDGATHDVAWVDAPSGAYVIAILSDTARDWAAIVGVSAAVYEALESP